MKYFCFNLFSWGRRQEGREREKQLQLRREAASEFNERLTRVADKLEGGGGAEREDGTELPSLQSLLIRSTFRIHELYRLNQSLYSIRRDKVRTSGPLRDFAIDLSPHQKHVTSGR